MTHDQDVINLEAHRLAWQEEMLARERGSEEFWQTASEPPAQARRESLIESTVGLLLGVLFIELLVMLIWVFV